jgi:hypothetical protein
MGIFYGAPHLALSVSLIGRRLQWPPVPSSEQATELEGAASAVFFHPAQALHSSAARRLQWPPVPSSEQATELEGGRGTRPAAASLQPVKCALAFTRAMLVDWGLSFGPPIEENASVPRSKNAASLATNKRQRAVQFQNSEPIYPMLYRWSELVHIRQS